MSSASPTDIPAGDAAPPDADWLRDRLRSLGRSAPAGWTTQRAPGARRAAVLVPIVLAPAPFVLLTRRSALLRHHAGQVSFPGGRPHPEDADAVATALREAREEVGLDPSLAEIVGFLPDQPTYVSGFVITPVVALLSPHATWSASPDEVDEILGLSLATLLDPNAPRRMTGGPRAGSWVWPHPDHDVWGATASILLMLARHLRDA